MAEPTTSKLPTAYDDATTLLGALVDQRKFTTSGAIDGSVTTIPTIDNLSDVEVPVYLLFLDNKEIIFAQGKSVDNTSFTNCLRGVRGSAAASHGGGTMLSMVISGQQMNMFREAIIAAQKYQGLVGLDAAKAGVPQRGEVYFATDSLKLYVCLIAGTWTWVGNRDHHADLNDLTNDACHSQYHTDGRALTWHNGLAGGHVTGGDAHDHGIASAPGAGRVQSGLSSARPVTPPSQREVYYETDTKVLFVSKGTTSSDWVRIVGAPTGAIAAFLEADLAQYGGTCPPGWSRYTALDGRLPKGAPAGVTSPLNTGGAATHTHTYTGVPAHTHTVPAVSATVTEMTSHNHTLNQQGPLAGGGFAITDLRNTSYAGTEDAGDHYHTITTPSHSTNLTKRVSDGTGSGPSATTGAGSSWPPYQEVLWCIKS